MNLIVLVGHAGIASLVFKGTADASSQANAQLGKRSSNCPRCPVWLCRVGYPLWRIRPYGDTKKNRAKPMGPKVGQTPVLMCCSRDAPAIFFSSLSRPRKVGPTLAAAIMPVPQTTIAIITVNGFISCYLEKLHPVQVLKQKATQKCLLLLIVHQKRANFI